MRINLTNSNEMQSKHIKMMVIKIQISSNFVIYINELKGKEIERKRKRKKTHTPTAFRPNADSSKKMKFQTVVYSI